MFRKDDASFRKLADGVVSDLMLSGRADELYTKWFQSPIPPRNINMNYPLSAGHEGAVRGAERQGVPVSRAGLAARPVRHAGPEAG